MDKEGFQGNARGILGDLRPLFTPAMLAFAWVPCMAIALLHYRTGPELAWVHDVLRRLFYLPILLAAFSAGLRGAVAISIFASLIYLPHAFTTLLGHDPGDALEKGLEIVLYNIVAVAAGLLVDRERRERGQAGAARTAVGGRARGAAADGVAADPGGAPGGARGADRGDSA